MPPKMEKNGSDSIRAETRCVRMVTNTWFKDRFLPETDARSATRPVSFSFFSKFGHSFYDNGAFKDSG